MTEVLCSKCGWIVIKEILHDDCCYHSAYGHREKEGLKK